MLIRSCGVLAGGAIAVCGVDVAAEVPQSLARSQTNGQHRTTHRDEK
jgi:hypothetical protein